MSSSEEHLNIGALIFPAVDQADVTGPFAVLSRLPNSSFYLLGRDAAPVRDMGGLMLTPDKTFADAPALDVLIVPGGFGQEALMEDEAVLGFIRTKAAGARYTFSVCTGALLCGAAGLLRGVRTTTHWAAHELLGYFGAIPVSARVVVDGKHVSAAGITAGIDGALRVAALLRGDRVAQQIQLALEYAPEPPFDCGSPETASPDVLATAKESFRQITSARQATSRRAAARLGIDSPSLS